MNALGPGYGDFFTANFCDGEVARAARAQCEASLGDVKRVRGGVEYAAKRLRIGICDGMDTFLWREIMCRET